MSIDNLIHDLEVNLQMMEMADAEWVIQDGCSWRRIGTATGRETDGTVLRPYVARDGHPDLQAAYGVLLHITLSQPRNVRLLLEEIATLRHELEQARERNLIANERADSAQADLERFRSERSYVVGCNTGWDEAIEQAAQIVEGFQVPKSHDEGDLKPRRYPSQTSIMIAAAIRKLAGERAK